MDDKEAAICRQPHLVSLAPQSSNKPMTVEDYVELADREIHFDTPDQEHNKRRRRLKSSFDISLWAVRDAKPVEQRYPAVILQLPAIHPSPGRTLICASTLQAMAMSFLPLLYWDRQRAI